MSNTATLSQSSGSPNLAILRRYYENPLLSLQENLAAGRQVAARLNNTVPTELMLAAGCVPILLKPPFGIPTPTATKYLDRIIEPATHAFFEAALSGHYADLALLVLGRSEDKLYYFLKELYRLGRAPTLPPLHIFDLMMSRRDAVKTYNKHQFEVLCTALERTAGTTLTEDALKAAIAVTNKIRTAQRNLLEARAQGHVNGADVLHAIGASYFMDPGSYATTLNNWLSELDPSQVAKGVRLLVISSEPLSYPDLHQAIEDAGGQVAAENDWWGARAIGGDIPQGVPPRQAIFEKAWLDTTDHDVYPEIARENWSLEWAARPDIEGVIFYIPPSDQKLGWDYPRLQRAVSALGKPTLLLRQHAADPAGTDSIRASVATFLNSGV